MHHNITSFPPPTEREKTKNSKEREGEETYKLINSMGRECHPLLKGGKRETKYSHGYSASELQTLTSISEVLLPPIPSEHDNPKHEHDQSPVDSFFRSSASQYPVPDEVFN